MKSLKLILIVSAALLLNACGPANMAVWNGTTWVAALTAKSFNDSFKDLNIGLACAFSTLFQETMWVEMPEAKVDELLLAISQSKVTSGADFWSKLPFEISNLWDGKIEEAYLNLSPDSRLLKQNVKFYKSLFAYGLMRARAEGIHSGQQSFVKTFISGSKKHITTTTFAVGILQWPSRHKQANGHEAPAQYTNFCP